MSDETRIELESIANELDSIADGLGSTNLLRARQIRPLVSRIVRIARNIPPEQPAKSRGET
jgi:hypothetical protein